MNLLVPAECESEISHSFFQKMINAMSLSFFKYGPIRLGYPKRVNAIASLKARLEKYEKNGNTEYLVDIANFAMIEFILPAHPNTNDNPSDSNESPGRIWNGEIEGVQDRNDLKSS